MRFATADRVGRGGMGVVYRSWDPQLGRPVALKVLDRDDSEAAERMLREARAQAGVQHPNVCAVYEVGYLDDRPFIAMQWIDGLPIDEVALSLPLEERVHLFLAVVEAVQAAHSVGLVHRDLKPANLLVEKGADGTLKPYVLDFGIARMQDAEGLTRTGQVVGTPGYMSPEQVRGDVDIDRRSDVFGLGCVLYGLLAGAPPFAATSPVEAVVKVLEEEPLPLRRRNPAVPVDLATVTARCLEKERDRRYGSARELATDLRRFLAGEPILARPVSVLYRWRRRVRRHPVAAAAVTAALLATASAAGFALHARAAASRQAALAQRFARTAERADARMRLAHLADLHDIRPEKAAVRRRLAALEAELPALGGAARGPGEVALGRGHLSLGEPELALEHLERAWADGYRTRDSARALAEALGTLYQRGLADAEREPDADARAARIADVQRRYRDRALELLRGAGAAIEDAGLLLRARLAFYEERYDEAAELAAKAAAATPWLYEASLLRGDAVAATGPKRRQKESDAELLARFDRAEAAYRDAARQGRSDPRVHESLCALGARRAVLQYFGSGEPLGPVVEEAVAACRTAAAADPDRGRPHALVSGLLLMQSRDLARHGEDPMPVIESAEREGREAVRLEPGVAEHSRSLGGALVYRAEFERNRGVDSDATLEKAVTALKRAVRLNPDDGMAYNMLGLAYWERIYWARNRGRDQMAAIEAAAEALRHSTELLPHYAKAYSNLGSIYNLRSEYETAHGLDPKASFAGAIAAFTRATQEAPGYTYALNNLGNAYRNRGEASLARGRDPEADLRRAVTLFQRAAKRNRKWSFPHFNTGLALGALARWQVENGADPATSFSEAAAAFDRGLAIKPDLPDALFEAARVQLRRARWLLETGGDPSAALTAAAGLLERGRAEDRSSGLGLELEGEWRMLSALAAGGDPRPGLASARRDLERSLARVPDSASALVRLARLELSAARWEAAHRGSPKPPAERGLAAARRALEINPRAARAEGLRGALALLLARSEREPGRADTARQAFAHAFELNPILRRRWGAAMEQADGLAASAAGAVGG